MPHKIASTSACTSNEHHYVRFYVEQQNRNSSKSFRGPAGQSLNSADPPGVQSNSTHPGSELDHLYTRPNSSQPTLVRRLPASKCGCTVGFPLFLLLGFGYFPIDPRQRRQLGQDGRRQIAQVYPMTQRVVVDVDSLRVALLDQLLGAMTSLPQVLLCLRRSLESESVTQQAR